MYLPDRLSPTPTPASAPCDLNLAEAVRFVDQMVDDDTGNLLLRLAGCPPKLGLLPLGDGHPFDGLLGFTAPTAWHAVGVRCPARVYRFDGPYDVAAGRADGATAQHEGSFVMALDRGGRGAGVVRHGDAVTELDEAPEGLVADACRRALGLATAPPPASTVELWIRIWLDRALEVVAQGDTPSLDGWAAVARLHPAAPMGPLPSRADDGPPVESCPTADPCELAEATQTLAAAWPWSHLRRDPEALDTGRPPVTGPIAEWMDDGLFARSVLAAIAELSDAAQALTRLLPSAVTGRVAETVRAAGLRWPTASW
jgi:hypothetical protein